MARILVIEDSPTDTAVLTQLLERNVHEVLSSGSAEDCIEVCKRELPDLVLIDVVLPCMNFFLATRPLSPHVPTLHFPVLLFIPTPFASLFPPFFFFCIFSFFFFF